MILSISKFDANNIQIDEESYKNILIYYIGYFTIKDLKYVKLSSVNLLYLIFSKVNGYFEEINLIKLITKNSNGYDEKYVNDGNFWHDNSS